MTETTEDQLDAVFHALADRTRRDILRRVMREGQSVSELAANYDMSFAAVQKHVAVLERAGLVTKTKEGRRRLSRGEITSIRSVSALFGELENVWRGHIARIDDLLAMDARPNHNEE